MLVLASKLPLERSCLRFLSLDGPNRGFFLALPLRTQLLCIFVSSHLKNGKRCTGFRVANISHLPRSASMNDEREEKRRDKPQTNKQQNGKSQRVDPQPRTYQTPLLWIQMCVPFVRDTALLPTQTITSTHHCIALSVCVHTISPLWITISGEKESWDNAGLLPLKRRKAQQRET